MIVFAGPSIAGLELPANTALEIRPPVRQGDVYLAALEEPLAIGIIDGYFDGMPSVWHKEILWAMSRGIAVLGASSMGALRAAELDAFGMIGVGAVYADYRDGVLEDDDEVALVHGPAELGYASLSVAMVNLRATLRAAGAATIIDGAQAAMLTDCAKAIFFKDRTWGRILKSADMSVITQTEREMFSRWIADNEIDQKRMDAARLLERMTGGDFETPAADFHFEQTDLWVHTTKAWRRRQQVQEQPVGEGYRLLGDTNLFG